MRYNLRHLRVFVTVAETGSVTRAAEACHVSQPAVTQAISKIEKTLGYPLFRRSPQGLFANNEGQLLALRVRRAFAQLDPALAELAPRLKVTATAAQIEALVAVSETENFTLAARRLGVAQPTVHRAVSQLEKEAARPLFERTSYGMVATRLAQNLARATRLALAELQQAEADLSEARAEESGQIVVGGMPLSRSSILPATIARFRDLRPNLPVRVVEGAYDELLNRLRRGEIDFLIGALRDPLPIEDVEQEALFNDTVIIVARTGHPLVGCDPITLDDLASYPWVVASTGTPIRAHFDALFAGKSPRSVVESSSLILMRELVARSDHLGFVSGGQAAAEIERGLMAPLPFDLAHTSRPIGITIRKDWLPTAAQAAFLSEIRHQARIADSENS